MIELCNVSKTYREGKAEFHALKRASLRLEPGEFVSILGPSGSGKSTLMHLMGALDRPSSGAVFIKDQYLGMLSDRELTRFRNRHIGFVFQFFQLIPYLTALENVRLPLVYGGLRIDRTAHAIDMLHYFGLENKIHSRITELSGGERQRVAIARAIICDPEIILADEPTGNLDSVNGAYVFDMLASLRELGKTIIVVTHDEHLAQRAQRIIRIHDGEIH